MNIYFLKIFFICSKLDGINFLFLLWVLFLPNLIIIIFFQFTPWKYSNLICLSYRMDTLRPLIYEWLGSLVAPSLSIQNIKKQGSLAAWLSLARRLSPRSLSSLLLPVLRSFPAIAFLDFLLIELNSYHLLVRVRPIRLSIYTNTTRSLLAARPGLKIWREAPFPILASWKKRKVRLDRAVFLRTTLTLCAGVGFLFEISIFYLCSSFAICHKLQVASLDIPPPNFPIKSPPLREKVRSWRFFLSFACIACLIRRFMLNFADTSGSEYKISESVHFTAPRIWE